MVVGQFGMGKSTLVSIVKFMMMKVIASIIVMVTVMSLRIKPGETFSTADLSLFAAGW